MKKEYVAGFCLSADGLDVALILKNRPAWQCGCWNGIGGGIEGGELPIDAMRREFEEETGVRVEGWKPFAVCTSAHDTVIHWFVAQTDDVYKIRTMTDERVQIFRSAGLPLICIYNINFLFDMAFRVLMGDVPGFEITERDLGY